MTRRTTLAGFALVPPQLVLAQRHPSWRRCRPIPGMAYPRVRHPRHGAWRHSEPHLLGMVHRGDLGDRYLLWGHL